MYRTPLLTGSHGYGTAEGHAVIAHPVAAEPQAHVRLRDRRHRPPGHRRRVHVARGVAVPEPAQTPGRRADRRRVGGEGDRAQAPLLPPHRQRTGGVAGEGAVLERAVPRRGPHFGEVRWTSLSTISIR